MMAEEGTNVLTGAAQAAARGELHGEMHLNVAARDAALMPSVEAEPATVEPISAPIVTAPAIEAVQAPTEAPVAEASEASTI